ncbi:uncharacterized protein LOC122972445 isoform X2 [Thunnus albacares]|uniref:uncharacterized protein LOC122972445 isoform X2 n=1 Tax=Thunnus albacares TaxID=8236 RepID=UPI001CF6249E|nr:uncharacterized protein LOC122972445 isoform X2 [Thunnus albacares]
MRILTITLFLLLVCLCALTNPLLLVHECCIATSKPRKTSIGPIKACYEQHPRPVCRHHAFLIETYSGRTICLDPNTPWLKQEINEGRLRCQTQI